MTKPQLRQLVYYVYMAGESGFYFGDKVRFLKRHKALIDFVDSIEILIDNPDVRIAK